ncbi:hypothetical protein F4775DRAFT_589785 [Biscogniauxia sp. FL1348]|nr:hypothetical protein F4775DRAFT_589785 [Biscogniauxia sp. FL1348]
MDTYSPAPASYPRQDEEIKRICNGRQKKTRPRKQPLAPSSPRPLFPQSSLLACEADGATRTRGCSTTWRRQSHTLSCVLEGCLVPPEVSDLPRPLTGIVFHHDTFISDRGGAPCEAAFIASHPDVKVCVLCRPTNFWAIKRPNKAIPEATVQTLQSDLNTQRMMDWT